MSDFKSEKFAGGWAAVDSSATNVASQAFAHFPQKCCQFLRETLGDELDPPVGQVLHESGHLKRAGNPGGGVPKTHPLHVPRVENLATLANGGSHFTLLTFKAVAQ